MSVRSKGARSKLGEPLQSEVADFCAAHYNAPERDIIRAALRHFIDTRLADEPAMRKRYEEARRKRLEGDKPLKLVKPEKS